MRFSRQQYWSGLPSPPPGYLPNPGVEHTSLTSPALAGGFFTSRAFATGGSLVQMEPDASLSPPVMGATDAPLVLPQGAGMGAPPPSLELPLRSGPPRPPLPVQPISAPSSFESSLPSQGVQSLKQPAWAPLHLPSEGDPTKAPLLPPHTLSPAPQAL